MSSILNDLSTRADVLSEAYPSGANRYMVLRYPIKSIAKIGYALSVLVGVVESAVKGCFCLLMRAISPHHIKDKNWSAKISQYVKSSFNSSVRVTKIAVKNILTKNVECVKKSDGTNHVGNKRLQKNRTKAYRREGTLTMKQARDKGYAYSPL